MNAVFEWVASLKWAIIAGLLSSSGACGKPGPGRAEMSGCSAEETSWLNNKQSQEASLLRDTAFMLWRNHTKEIQLLLRSLVHILWNYTDYATHLSKRSTFTKIPPPIKDDDMQTKTAWGLKRIRTKLLFTDAHIQRLATFRSIALSEQPYLCEPCSPRMHKIYKHMFMCSWL